MISLSQLQTVLLQANPVRLDRFRPYAPCTQNPKVPRKPRVGIPTAKQLETQSHHKHIKDEMFHELPEGADADSMDWKCMGLGDQPVLELPTELRKLWTNAKGSLAEMCSELYTTEYDGTTGVWYAVLFGLDPEFITRTFTNQQKCVTDMKRQMCIELDDYYQTYKYRQYGYMKSNMDKVLTQSDEFHSTLGHFLSDFLRLNVLVLLENRRFHWLGRFDEQRHTLVLYHKGMKWGAIVHPDQQTHLLDVVTVQRLTHTLQHMSALDASHKHSNLVMDAAVLAKLKREIKLMKIRELQDRALELELLIEDDLGKKKLKKDLQEEIYRQLTGCDDF